MSKSKKRKQPKTDELAEVEAGIVVASDGSWATGNDVQDARDRYVDEFGCSPAFREVRILLKVPPPPDLTLAVIGDVSADSKITVTQPAKTEK